MAPKSSKNNSKKSSDQEGDPGYSAKRARNNEAVRKSREKSKKIAEKTKERVKKLREQNKVLEGKIEEQKKAKKFLKDLFLQQTTAKLEQPTKEQWDMISKEYSESSDDEESSENSDASMESGEESNVGSPPPSSSRKR